MGSEVTFIRAARRPTKLRLALCGPSGSGKTYTALALATGLAKRVALIDTEYGSSELYGDLFPFDRCVLETFGPEGYVGAIHTAEQAGYEAIVIDSLSHAWMGRGGTLEQVDHVTASGKSSHLAWSKVTPALNALVDAMVRSPAHVIATLRSKTEHGVDHDDKGKLVIRRFGLAPVQREGLEYEFDLGGELDLEHRLTLSKSRAPGLAGRVFEKPGAELAGELTAWLALGTPRPVPPSGTGLGQAIPWSPGAQPEPSVSQPVLARIEAARTPADLNSILKALQALPEAEQVVVRPIFNRRKNEVLKAAQQARSKAKAGAA